MSAFGPNQTSASALHMSAFGGKADMLFLHRICLLVTQSGHQLRCHNAMSVLPPKANDALDHPGVGHPALMERIVVRTAGVPACYRLNIISELHEDVAMKCRAILLIVMAGLFPAGPLAAQYKAEFKMSIRPLGAGRPTGLPPPSSIGRKDAFRSRITSMAGLPEARKQPSSNFCKRGSSTFP